MIFLQHAFPQNKILRIALWQEDHYPLSHQVTSEQNAFSVCAVHSDIWGSAGKESLPETCNAQKSPISCFLWNGLLTGREMSELQVVKWGEIHLAFGTACLSCRSQINEVGGSRALGSIFPLLHCSAEMFSLEKVISEEKCFSQAPATKGKFLTLSLSSCLVLVASLDLWWLVEPNCCFLTSTTKNKATQCKEHNYVKQS